MAVGFVNMNAVLSGAIATNGTITFTYPSGFTVAADFAQAGETMAIPGLQNVLKVGAGKFSLAYGAGSVVATYLGTTTIPAGSTVSLSAAVAKYAKLTDSSGGTASQTVPAQTASYVQADVRNAFATITAKINTILDILKANDKFPS